MSIQFPMRFTIPALIFIAGSAILASAWYFEHKSLNNNMLEMAENQIRSGTTFVAAQLEAALRNNDTSTVRATIERTIADPHYRTLIIAGVDGRIEFASDQELVGKPLAEVALQHPWIETLGLSNFVAPPRIEQLPDAGRLAARVAIQMRGDRRDLIPNRFGALFLIYDVSMELGQQKAALSYRMLVRTLVIGLVALGFWALIRALVLRRIDDIRCSLRAVSRGDFHIRPQTGGRDELGDLAREVDHMIENLKEQAEELAYLAKHDPLTGMQNRQGFEDDVDHALRLHCRGIERFAVCLLDIDSLRVINDTRGHLAGDELLRAFGNMLTERIPRATAIARLGGDEFAMLIALEDSTSLQKLAESIQNVVRKFRFSWNNDRFGMQVSLGVVQLYSGLADAEEAIGLADMACYTAKETGRGKYAIWSPGRVEWAETHGRMRWVSEIQKALDEDRFRLFAQPIAPLSSRGEVGLHFEILVRMIDTSGNIVAPGEFLGAAEKYNLIGQIDRWVIRNTMEWLASHPDARNRTETCAINLSGLSFGDRQVLEEIGEQLAKGNLDPAMFCFEVTETAAITNLQNARGFVEKLRSQGFQFALDDFGTGLSSFSYLKHLPVDLLKIDGSFVRDISTDPADRAIVCAINDIGHNMGLKTIAEFAENHDVIQVLREIGVDYAQGYGIARPAPIEEMFKEYKARRIA